MHAVSQKDKTTDSAFTNSTAASFEINEHTTLPQIHPNILSTIGNTPIVRLNKLAPDNVDIFVKLEAFNPLGSVKDRLAIGIIEAAERDGSLKPGQTVVEATSGNTGIGLAMVCAQKGYPLVVTMAENFSVERRRLMRFLGAKVVLTPASDMGSGMLAKAIELADEHGWFLCRQFANEANANIHSSTTAKEIVRDFPNDSLDYFISGFGTGGTLKGVARVLRQESPGTKIIATEPDNSPVLTGGIRQEFNASGDPQGSHPAFRPHLMQGWSPDFVSKLTDDAVSDQLIDGIVPVSGAEALNLSRALAQQEGIFCGISAGATLAGALEIAKTAPTGSKILCILPDTGERYLSTPLFADVSEAMNDEEIMISRSTNGYRFDIEASDSDTNDSDGQSDVPQEVVEPSDEARAFVQEVTNSRDNPIVVFSLEWCEFCWSVGKLFDQLGIPYQSVDLDSVEYQKNDWGAEVREALDEITGVPTIPQVFIGGEHVGGCTDTFDAFNNQTLQSLLNQHGISWKPVEALDPYRMLPTWLHPR